jgi:hypothetical protein
MVRPKIRASIPQCARSLRRPPGLKHLIEILVFEVLLLVSLLLQVEHLLNVTEAEAL